MLRKSTFSVNYFRFTEFVYIRDLTIPKIDFSIISTMSKARNLFSVFEGGSDSSSIEYDFDSKNSCKGDNFALFQDFFFHTGYGYSFNVFVVMYS